MLAVAFGHWLAISVFVDDSGQLTAGNALDLAPEFAPLSWMLQVMPLFFVVGGFASAASLDAHSRGPGSRSDWLAARLRRLFAPVAVLAAFWLAVIGLSHLAGVGHLGFLAATAGAIPLWFIANYAIDTAIAPVTLPAFRANPARFCGLLIGAIASLEILRFVDFGVFSDTLPHLNWILGWLGFQVAGFAWKDGIITPGRTLAITGGALLGVAALLVTVGPYPVSMVHFDGIGNLSPTHPPSLALIFFGAGYSALAISAAPWVNRLLERQPLLWKLTVAANSVAMSVYLWHFTAAAVAGAAFYALGILPTAATGSPMWWLQKMPLIVASTVVLAGIVALVARFERSSLLAPRRRSIRSYPALVAIAALLSLSVKSAWASGSPFGIVVGSTVVLGVFVLVLNRPDLRIRETLSSVSHSQMGT